MIRMKVSVPSRAAVIAAFSGDDGHYGTMAKATTLAMRDAAEVAKQRGRASIRAAGPGFQRRWPNALRADTYPKKRNVYSAGPAALVYIRSNYAGIFEYGGDIAGSPLLWLPLPAAPKTVGGKRIRPGLLPGLFTLNRPGKPPLLAVAVRGTAQRLNGPISLTQIRRGTRGARGGQTRIVPLFVGVPRVRMPKKWGVVAATRHAQAQLPTFYLKHIKA